LVAPVPAPIPHTLDGREDCFTCHAIGAVDAPPVPADHDQDVTQCTACHAVWLAPAIAAVAPPAISHDLVGRDDCLMCHKVGTAGAPRVPDNHNDLSSTICQACHTSASEITGAAGEGEEAPLAEAPSIPHGLEGFRACSQCHEEGGAGIPQFPDDHQGRTDDMCSACHSPAVEPAEAEPTASTGASSAATGDPAYGEILFSETCVICHGDAGEGTAIAPDALNDATFLEARTDEDLAMAIREGVGNRMPPFSELSEQEVMDLIAHLRSWQ
jgi:cytochrome c5